MSMRILVVDDHDVVRQGVLLILKARPEWQVVGEAADGVEAVEKAKHLDPDVIILDISMPKRGGLEVLADLQRMKSRAKVLVLSMHESKELASQVRRLGAAGYINKTNAGRDLLRALDAIVSGNPFFPAEASNVPKPQGEKGDKDTGMLRKITPGLA
jgi:two-component system response regulator NreC